MLMLTGQKPIKASKQGHFQILDVVEMMDPVTKYSRQIVHGSNVPAKIRVAFRVAEQERPGAVHLELPVDIAREEACSDFLFPIEKVRRPAAEAKAITLAVERLQEAKRPLLLIGAGANRSQTSKTLQAFVEKTGIPFFTTQMGKGVLDERQAMCLGTAALSENDILNQAIDAADLVVNVGHDVVEKPPFFMTPGGLDVIHVNYSPAEVDPVYFPRFQVIGDVANAVWQLTEAVVPQSHWETACFVKVREALRQQADERSSSDSFPLKPQRIVRDVRRALPEDGIVALDNGMYKIWFARNYPAYQPNTVLLDNALASMGAGLPSAMAAALIYPDRKVVAVCGDGGFMMNSQELETAVRLGMNLVVLIVRDDAYGMIRWKQEDMKLPDFGMALGNPDFVRYAESYGAHGHRVERTADLAGLLRKCLDAPGVHLIDCPIDYGDSQNELMERIPERSRQFEA
jgi:acetolactate synthase-1/2/3 large subunit